MTEFTTCFECDQRVAVDKWADHECPADPRNGPYDLDQWDTDWAAVDDSDEEVGS